MNILRDLISEGAIGPLHSGGHEIIRRLFVSVRDRNWHEVTPARFDIQIDESDCSATLSARHSSELVDFEWKGRLSVNQDLSRVKFSFEGQALRDMEICRLGLVVLHPVSFVVGAQLTAVGPQGSQHLTVSDRVYPQPIVEGVPGAMTDPFSELTLARADLGKLKLHFRGDLFELEDQRNWGDASFKTYCTPLQLGFPRTIKQGATIQHAVEASFEPAYAAQSVVRKSAATQIGRVLPRLRGALDNESWSSGWDHIQVTVDCEDIPELERVVSSLPVTTRLELVLRIAAGTGWPPAMRSLLIRNITRITRLLVRDATLPLPTPEAITRARRTLEVDGLGALPIFVLPNGYFVELNRGRPLELEVDGVAFPLSPSVHSDDPRTIVENADAIFDMITTVRRTTGTARVAISPLTLDLPASRRRFSNSLALPWLSATIARAAAAGVESVTLAPDLLSLMGR